MVASHLWQLGRAVKGEEHAAGWVEARLHQLRHGKEKKVLEETHAIDRCDELHPGRKDCADLLGSKIGRVA